MKNGKIFTFLVCMCAKQWETVVVCVIESNKKVILFKSHKEKKPLNSENAIELQWIFSIRHTAKSASDKRNRTATFYENLKTGIFLFLLCFLTLLCVNFALSISLQISKQKYFYAFALFLPFRANLLFPRCTYSNIRRRESLITSLLYFSVSFITFSAANSHSNRVRCHPSVFKLTSLHVCGVCLLCRKVNNGGDNGYHNYERRRRRQRDVNETLWSGVVLNGCNLPLLRSFVRSVWARLCLSCRCELP